LKDVFLAYLKSPSRRVLLVGVDLSYSVGDIQRAFNELMKSPGVRDRLVPTKPSMGREPRLLDLQKYLTVFDVWKEKRAKPRKRGDTGLWDEIVKHFEPEEQYIDDDLRRIYRRYKRKAETIIKNLELGIFPGPY